MVPKLPELVAKRTNDDLQLFPKVNDNQNKSVKYSCIRIIKNTSNYYLSTFTCRFKLKNPTKDHLLI